MAVRILFLILGFTILVNLILTIVGLIFGVNLYKKFGKEILTFFALCALFIVGVYIVFMILGL